jgi:hypothetical protein
MPLHDSYNPQCLRNTYYLRLLIVVIILVVVFTIIINSSISISARALCFLKVG